MEWVWRGQINKGMVISQSSLCLIGLPNKGTGLLNCTGACGSHPQRGCPFCLQVSGVLWMGGWLRKWWVRSKQEPLSGCSVVGLCGLAPPQCMESWGRNGEWDWNRQLCGVLLLASVSVVLFLLSRTAWTFIKFLLKLLGYSCVYTSLHSAKKISVSPNLPDSVFSNTPWRHPELQYLHFSMALSLGYVWLSTACQRCFWGYKINF